MRKRETGNWADYRIVDVDCVTWIGQKEECMEGVKYYPTVVCRLYVIYVTHTSY